MTDEIYDYFGGNAPKKVEPVEDDDLEPVEAPVAEEQPVVPEDQPAIDEPVAAENVDVNLVEAKEEVDSWGSLLGELGIEDVAPRIKPAPVVAKPAGDSKPENAFADETKTVPDVQESAVKGIVEKSVDFLGLDPIPSPEDDTVLPDMFAPSGDPDFSKTTSEETSEEGEYLEFEIEELDESPYKEGEEESFGRRSRRRPQFDEQEAENRQSDRRPSRGRGSRTDDGTRARRTPQKSNRDQGKSDSQQSDFAADIEFESDAPTEVEKPKRSRRRSRGRGRGRGRDRDREPEISGEADDAAPTAEIVDEIGWEVPASKASSERDNLEPGVADDDMVDFADEPESEPAGRSRPKRRRRRGSKTRSDRQPEERETEPDADFSEDATDLDVDFGDDIQSDVDDREVDRSRTRRRRSSGRSSRRNEAEEAEESEAQGSTSKRPKFPTWEEAVASMIESNIKNHSRSSGRGGSGGRGRGRGRSGGRNAR